MGKKPHLSIMKGGRKLGKRKPKLLLLLGHESWGRVASSGGEEDRK